MDFRFHKTGRHSWNSYEAKWIAITSAFQPNRFPVMSNHATIRTDTDCVGQPIGYKMSPEIIGKSFRIFETRSQAGNFISGLEEYKRNIFLSQKVGGGQTCHASAQNSDRFFRF